MIFTLGATGSGRTVVVVGLEHVSLTRLLGGDPMIQDVPNLPLVVVWPGKSPEVIVAELVDRKLLPAKAAEQFAPPEPDEARVFDGGDWFTVPGEGDREPPDDVDVWLTPAQRCRVAAERERVELERMLPGDVRRTPLYASTERWIRQARRLEAADRG